MPSNAIRKGRPVSGPRTKLAASVRLSNLEKQVGSIEEALVRLADSTAVMAKAYLRKEDDMMATPPVEDEDDDFEDEGDGFDDEDELEAPMDLADDFDSDFDPYGDTEDDGGAYNEGEDTENELGIHDGDLTKAIAKAQRSVRPLNRARVRKDDAASSFGEKDDDVPGNRRLVPDDKGKPAEEFLIQGGPDDGQGVNKALRKAVRRELVSAGVIRKATSPRVGGSQIGGQGDEVSYQLPSGQVLKGAEAVAARARNMSFQELNRLRAEMGELPTGIL